MVAEHKRGRAEAPEAQCPLCDDLGEPWREKAGFLILRCVGCQNGFLPAESVPADLEDLYSHEYFEGDQGAGYPSYLADAALLERNFERRVAWLSEFVEPGRVLDVGTAYGFFLKAAKAAGWDTMGVEIAPDCALDAARIADAPVLAADFVTADVPGRFDVITMLDVLEHVRDPVACIEKARSLLVPGGWLVVETGDIACGWARFLGNHWYFLDPPNHLHYFSLAGFEATLRRCGFDASLRVSRIGRRVSFRNVAFKLANGLPEGAARATALRLASRRITGSIYLNFRDSMIVAARREPLTGGERGAP
ncbi:MAG: class I SAM-dependent methyltransferase [Myxococcota bacterium]